jgi:hypothetical protein
MKVETIQEELATLPPDAQKIIFDLVMILKKCHNLEPKESLSSRIDDWSDFIGCAEAEPDLSINYKSYLNQESDQKL